MILGLGAASTVSFSNLSHPGSVLRVGDSWEVRISGPPNTPVSATGVFPNGDIATTPFGSTNAAGILSITGEMKAEHVGHWVVTWHVGDTDASPVLNFDVVTAPEQVFDESVPSPTSGTPWLLIGVAVITAWFLLRGRK